MEAIFLTTSSIGCRTSYYF